MQTIYTRLKVNNEVELCEIYDFDVKEQIEKILLKKRISYYIKWPKPRLFKRRNALCILCINDYSRDEAEIAIKELGLDIEDKLQFVMRKSDNEFF